ncbi:MAG: hypothetical protein C0468_03120 [Planctomyces sp.]|nr:hypothetical protein [Planctomyces sp.]
MVLLRKWSSVLGRAVIAASAGVGLVQLAVTAKRGDQLGAQPAERAGGAGDGVAPNEGPYLSGAVQLTLPGRFVRAGEAYFDHLTPPRNVIFQAEERGAGAGQYAMYVAPLRYDSRQAVIGLGEPTRLSAPGSANTCGWFFPSDSKRVLFGSTLGPVAPEERSPGYQRDSGRYRWSFPSAMRIVTATITKDAKADGPVEELVARPGGDGYAAEASWSPDGRFLLYTHVDPATGDADLWVWDSGHEASFALVREPGYDGGGFFSPDGQRVCYRSDRRGNGELQVYVADLAFDPAEPALITGVRREVAITDDPGVVNWAPFWHPTGSYLVFASSRAGHTNYELEAIEVLPQSTPGRRARVTHAAGFDGLPAYSRDGTLLMWTSQRGPKNPDGTASSQLWVASVIGDPAWEPAGPRAASPGAR